MTQIGEGTTISGRYRLEERLDAGGAAQVWRAHDQELNRLVAIKILLTPEGGDPAFVEAFRDEAQADASLKHPGIVEVFDWGHDGDANFIVMELLPGETVARLIQEGGPLGWERALNTSRQVAAAVAYAHAAGIAHGTIDAEKVVVGPDGRTTVLGFGIHCRGACEYPAVPDTDTYLVGLLMYQMLTGAHATGPRPADIAENQPWPMHPHKIHSDIPAEFDRIVMKAINPDPPARYATAASLQADLDQLARPKSRVWVGVLLAILAVVLVGLGTWFLATQTKVVVPDLTGKTQTDAQAVLTSAGLKMVVTGQVPSAEVAAGSVVSESPTAGTKVRRGAQVGVMVSTGKPTATVPSVTGLSLSDASGQIASAGLIVGAVTHQNSSTFPTNTVISSNPAAGQTLTAGDKVDLVVSAGQALVTVPDVRGMSQSSATSKLNSLGLKVDVGQAFSGQPNGNVVSQGPAPGTTVPAGATVTISVSKGPAPVTVPDVTDALAADARASITGVGLVPVTTETSGTPSQVGRVISQDPSGGEKVAPGSQVEIVVGK